MSSVNDGVLLVDKPQGLTSAQVVAKVKRKLDGIKVGHAGTLDPMATGLLVLLCGKATRLQSEYMGGNKVYQGVIKLGLATDTDDVTGKVIAEDSEKNYTGQDLKALEKEIEQKFTGTMLQMPPIFSAKKVKGKRSYQLARAGKEVKLEPKEVSIEKLKVFFFGC